MIFVTVGTQLPFERLVAAVDEWAGRATPRPDVLAQVGAGRLDYPNMRCVRALDGSRYAEVIAQAELMIAHAGTGSILTALDRGVPVIVMPRDHRQAEHRDDHQSQTARQLEKMGLASVAWNASDLPELIEAALARSDEDRPSRQRSTELVDYIRSYLQVVLQK